MYTRTSEPLPTVVLTSGQILLNHPVQWPQERLGDLAKLCIDIEVASNAAI